MDVLGNSTGVISRISAVGMEDSCLAKAGQGEGGSCLVEGCRAAVLTAVSCGLLA